MRTLSGSRFTTGSCCPDRSLYRLTRPIRFRTFSYAATTNKGGMRMTAEPSTSRPKRSSSDVDTHRDAPSSKKRPPAEDAEEAMTEEELEATEAPEEAPGPSSPQPPTKPRNAFSELMTPKSAKPKNTAGAGAGAGAGAAAAAAGKKKSSSFRDNLGTYLANPSSFPPSQVIFHTDAFVAVHDLYPKATVHCLLLPRAGQFNRLHPFDALSSSPEFLASVRAGAARLADLAARELQRRLGRFSASDARRNALLDGDPAPTEAGAEAEVEVEVDAAGHAVVPAGGRDWAREVQVGVHAVPSMNHLHVHVLSRDMRSDRLRHRKHYNSFTTDFFVPLDAFPLAGDDWRRGRGAQRDWPERPMVCWRCGRDFGNRFKELKAHLEVEFEEWKRE